MSLARKTEPTVGWRNRITGHGQEEPDQLLANPRNWRVHPKAQQEALAAVLDQVGWVQDVIVNQRSGHIVDGHARIALAISKQEPTVPVVYVDLDEDEERLILGGKRFQRRRIVGKEPEAVEYRSLQVVRWYSQATALLAGVVEVLLALPTRPRPAMHRPAAARWIQRRAARRCRMLNPGTPDLGAAAAELALAGWSVLPCHPIGSRAKSPVSVLVPHGHLNATRDPEVIERWWRECPNAMIGGVVPASLIVIDIDPRNGGTLAILEALVGALPETLTVWSGRNDGGRRIRARRTGRKPPDGLGGTQQAPLVAAAWVVRRASKALVRIRLRYYRQ